MDPRNVGDGDGDGDGDGNDISYAHTARLRAQVRANSFFHGPSLGTSCIEINHGNTGISETITFIVEQT